MNNDWQIEINGESVLDIIDNLEQIHIILEAENHQCAVKILQPIDKLQDCLDDNFKKDFLKDEI
ncbi:MAG: hypothetical protein ABIJ97_08945 [Bacteroidota bacterium]